ncbi:MAG: PEP-CTERM sorting domain-containing protein [Rubrivivax sp.]
MTRNCRCRSPRVRLPAAQPDRACARARTVHPENSAGRLTISSVPEPGQWALFAPGLAAVGAVTRRQRGLRA